MKLEKGVAIPRAHAVGTSLYPFPNMKIGDSFIVPLVKGATAASAASWYGKRHKMKFISRRFENGVRIWRVK